MPTPNVVLEVLLSELTVFVTPVSFAQMVLTGVVLQKPTALADPVVQIKICIVLHAPVSPPSQVLCTVGNTILITIAKMPLPLMSMTLTPTTPATSQNKPIAQPLTTLTVPTVADRGRALNAAVTLRTFALVAVTTLTISA